jgi:hypothetical protein
MPPQKPTGFQGAGADEPPFATGGSSPGAGGDMAAALESAAAAEGTLAQATEKRQRLNRDDPAVQAARTAADALRDQADAEDRLRTRIEARVKAQSGLSTGAAPSRINPDLDDAMGFAPPRSHRPAAEQAGKRETFREIPKASREERETGPDGTDSRMAAALRAERELAGAMRERLSLAKTLAGQPSVPTGGTGGARGYGGPATVGGERAGASKVEQAVVKLERTDAAMRAAGELRARGTGLEIHDEGREAADARRGEEPRTRFQRQLDEKRAGEGGPGLVGMAKAWILANPLGHAMSLASAGAKVSDIMATPYVSARDRGIDVAESLIPGVSWLGKIRQDIAHPGGRRKGEEYVADSAIETGVRVGAIPDWVRRRQEFALASRYEDRLSDPDFSRRIRRQVADPRRDTVGRAIAYREDLVRLPTDDRYQDARLGLVRAQTKGRSLDDALGDVRGQYGALARRRGTLLNQERAAIAKGDEGAIKMARADLLSVQKQMEEYEEQRIQLQRGQQENKLEISARATDVRQAKIGQAEAELGILTGRESKARSQATNLGMMGVDGRMQAMLAKQVVDQIGLENAPSQLIGMASAAFPEVVQKDAERAGQKFQPQFQQLAPEEYQDTVEGSTKVVDEAMAKFRKMQEDSIRREAESLRQAFEAMADILFSQRISIVETMIETLKRESELKGTK